MRRLPTTSVLLGVAALVLIASACDPPSDTEARTGCASTIAAASVESEPDAQVRLLDRAMVVCGSYRAFSTQLERYPASIGYDAATYIERRCETVADEAVRDGPTCATVIAPATTAPPTTLVALLFVGDTVDGRPIEMRPGPDIEFVGDVPAVIQQTVDIAFEAGCDGVLAQRDRWVEQIDDSPDGDIASVYAQHAQNVAEFIRCDTDEIDAG